MYNIVQVANICFDVFGLAIFLLILVLLRFEYWRNGRLRHYFSRLTIAYLGVIFSYMVIHISKWELSAPAFLAVDTIDFLSSALCVYFFSQYVFTYLENKKIEPNPTFRKIVVALCFAIFFLELGVDLTSDDLTHEWSATEIVISWLATGVWGIIMTAYIFYYRKQLGKRAFILFAVYCIWPFIAGSMGALTEELNIDILSLTILIACIFVGLQVSENTSHKLFEKLSYYDAMTGFYNKNYLIMNPDDFKRTLPCSYVIFDLNHLKRINDNFGHKKGDEYIRNFANFLKKMVPEEAETIRTGGDEFLVILPKYDQEKCQAFLEAYATESQIQGISESAAYGFAVRTTGVQTEDEVIAAADKQMYQQKKASREGRL